MNNTKTNKISLKKFGLTMAVCFALIALVVFIRHRHSPLAICIISFFFLLISLIVPGLLRYVYIIWMKLAFVLGWVNTRILLCIIFYLIFSPLGLIMRIFRIDLLDRRFNCATESYWKAKSSKEFSQADYQRRF